MATHESASLRPCSRPGRIYPLIISCSGNKCVICRMLRFWKMLLSLFLFIQQLEWTFLARSSNSHYRHQKLIEMCIWIYIQNPITATSSDCCLWVKKNYLRAQTNLVLRQLVTAACLRATSVVPGCSDPILWPAVEMQELWKMPGRDQREVSHPAKCSYFCIHQRMNQITPECEN